MTGVQTCALPICFPVTIFGLKAHVIIPDDLDFDGDGDDGFLEHYGEKAEVPEEEKYSSEDAPKVKS